MPTVTNEDLEEAFRFSQEYPDDPQVQEKANRIKEQYRAQVSQSQQSLRAMYQDRDRHGWDDETYERVSGALATANGDLPKFINERFFADTYGIPEEKVRPMQAQLLEAYSTKVWGEPVTDDRAFFDRMGEEMDREDEVFRMGRQMALDGKGGFEADAAFDFEFGADPKLKTRAETLRKQFRQAYDKTKDDISGLGVSVDDYVEELKRSMGVSEDKDAEPMPDSWFVETVLEMPADRRDVFLSAVAARSGEGEEKSLMQAAAEAMTRQGAAMVRGMNNLDRMALLTAMKKSVVRGNLDSTAIPEEYGFDPTEALSSARDPEPGTAGLVTIPKPGTPEYDALSDDQKAALERIDKEFDYITLTEQVKGIAEGRIDPAKGSNWYTSGVIGVSRMAPNIGVMALGQIGAVLNIAAYGGQATTDYMLENPGADPEVAADIGVVTGIAQGLLDKIPLKVVQGKIPFFSEWLEKATLTRGGLIGRGAVRLGAGTAVEVGQEFAQDVLAPGVVEEIAQVLKKDLPDANWDKRLEAFTSAETMSELIPSIVMLSMIGAGVGGINDYQGGWMLAGNRRLLIGAGIDPEAADAIVAAAKQQDARTTQTLLRDAFTKIDAGPVSKVLPEAQRAAFASLKKEIEDKRMAVFRLEKSGVIPQVVQTAEGFEVSNAEGVKRSFATREEAQTARWEYVAEQGLEIHEDVASVIDRLDRGIRPDARKERNVTGVSRTLLDAKREGQVTAEEAMDRANLAEQIDDQKSPESPKTDQGAENDFDPDSEYQEAVDAAILASLDEDDRLAAMSIVGESKTVRNGRIFETTTKLNRGATWETVIEEDAEGDAKTFIQKGLRDWLADKLFGFDAQFQQGRLVNGRKLSLFADGTTRENVSDKELVEAYSHLTKYYFVGTMKKGRADGFKASEGFRARYAQAVRAGLLPIFDPLARLYRAIALRATRLEKMRREGRLDAELERELARSVGMTEQVEYEQKVTEEATRIREEIDPGGNLDSRTTIVEEGEGFQRTVMPDGAVIEGPATFSVIAHHGTPHKVDRFQTRFIGTGEGAQVYGWGLYFAEAKNVAERYARELITKVPTQFDGQDYNHDDPRHRAGLRMRVSKGDRSAALAKLEKVDEEAAQVLRERNEAKIREIGNVYTVELLPDADDFLDWDKPLSEQSEKVKAALQFAGLVDLSSKGDLKLTGSDIYGDAGGSDSQQKSMFLLSLGIPGIRYLDGNSRRTTGGEIIGVWQGEQARLEDLGKGKWFARVKVTNRSLSFQNSPTTGSTTSPPFESKEEAQKWAEDAISQGTSNYVIFDESLVRILEENGQPVEQQGGGTTFSVISDIDPEDLTPVENRIEAERLFADGFTIYASNEIDEELVEIESLDMMDGYTEFMYDPDRGSETTFSALSDIDLDVFEHVYLKNEKRFEDAVASGRAKKGVPVTSFLGQALMLHQPDTAFAGDLRFRGETVVQGKGGVYYPMLFGDTGDFWASTESAAKGMADSLNEISAANNGKILMGLTSAPVTKLFSSTTMATGMLDVLVKVSKSTAKYGLTAQTLSDIIAIASQVQVKKVINKKESIKQFEKPLREGGSLKKNLEAIKEQLKPENSTFDLRYHFVRSVAKQVAKNFEGKPEESKRFASLLVGDENLYAKGAIRKGKLSEAAILQGFGDLFSEQFLKSFQSLDRGGYLYAVVEMDGQVEAVSTDNHDSYPFVIRSTSGKKPIVSLIDKAMNWHDVVGIRGEKGYVPQEKHKSVFPTSGVSSKKHGVLEFKKPRRGADPGLDIATFSVLKKNAKEIKAEVDSMSSDQIREALEKATLTPTLQMVELLGEFPEYLEPVVDYIMGKRDSLVNGNVSVRDVAKAYWITVASIGADAIDVETIRRQADSIGIPFDPSPMFLSYGKKGQPQMRPEELAAWWLGTPEGQTALNNIEAGKFNQSDWETGLKLRDAFGRNDLNEKTTKKGSYVAGGVGSPKPNKFNLRNITDLTDQINASKGNPAKLEKALMSLNNIAEGKKGFIGHMLGFGEWATLDAVELNIWLTGKGSTTYQTESKKRIAAIAKKASGTKALSKDLFGRIRKRINALRKDAQGGTKIPEEVAAHIIHHWIWDKAKGIETTHQGVYHAMETFSVLSNAESRIADSFNPYLRSPEKRRKILLDAQFRAREKAREFQDIILAGRTAAQLDREQATREGVIYGDLLVQYFGADTDEKVAALPPVDRKAARSEAKRQAEQWRKMQDRQQKALPRETLIAAMRTLDAMIVALPSEIRGKIGGMVRLATLTEPGAMVAELERRAAKLDDVLEDYLSKEADKQVKRLFKVARPAKDESGKARKGKAGADIHDLFDMARRAWKSMSATDAEAHAQGLEAAVATGNLTPEEEAHKLLEAELVRSFGGWQEADAERRNHALDVATDIWTRGYHDYKAKKVAEKGDRDRMRTSLRAATGKSGKKSDRVKAEEAGLKWTGSAKEKFFSLLNFDQLVTWIFGDSPVAKWFIDAQREAENRKIDAVQEVVDGVEDLFSTLAGGNRFKGEQLQYRMMQRSIKATAATGDVVPLSELEAISALLMWMQEDGRRHMKGRRDDNGKLLTEWSYDQDFIDEISAQMTPEGWKVLGYLIQEYGKEYEPLNAVYREVYGINLPRHANYSPLTVKPVQAQQGQTIDPTTGSTVSAGSFTPGSLRTRAQVSAEPDFRDAIGTFLSHKKQIEHWKAHAILMREAQGVLGNRELGNSVEASSGPEAVRILRKWIDLMAQGGNRDAAAGTALMSLFDRMVGRSASMALVGRMGTLMIQATQLGAATAAMPTGAYLARLSRLLTGNLGWGAAMSSPYIQRRLKQAPVAVRLAMDGLQSSEPTRLKHAVREIGKLLSGADALFTAGTFAIVHDYQKTRAIKAGMSEAEADALAEKEAERIVENLAQPTRMGTRSFFEVSATGSLGKLAWAFGSDARKNFALLGYSLAKGTPAEKARALLFVVGVNGILSGLIRNIWRDMRDEEDEEVFDEKYWSLRRLALGASTDWLFGFPIVGEEIQGAIYSAAGEYRPDSGLFSAIAQTPGAVKNLAIDFDSPDVLRDVEKIVMAAGLFNDSAAAFSSVLHILRDVFDLGSNIIPD